MGAVSSRMVWGASWRRRHLSKGLVQARGPALQKSWEESSNSLCKGPGAGAGTAKEQQREEYGWGRECEGEREER